MSVSLIAFDKLRTRLDELERRLANLELRAAPQSPYEPLKQMFPRAQPPQLWDGCPADWGHQVRD